VGKPKPSNLNERQAVLSEKMSELDETIPGYIHLIEFEEALLSLVMMLTVRMIISIWKCWSQIRNVHQELKSKKYHKNKKSEEETERKRK
jgi:hypothetical protein